MEMPCCSFGKTRWKRLGPLSSPSSQMPQLCIYTSQARGDPLRRIVWLWIWAVGITPRNTKRAQSLSRTPRNSIRTSDHGQRLLRRRTADHYADRSQCDRVISHEFLNGLGCEFVRKVKSFPCHASDLASQSAPTDRPICHSAQTPSSCCLPSSCPSWPFCRRVSWNPRTYFRSCQSL